MSSGKLISQVSPGFKRKTLSYAMLSIVNPVLLKVTAWVVSL